MLTATLGGLIKDYRIKKRLSQIEISAKIGWKDTSRLSKIEQGRVGKPVRETIEKIINALALTEQEKGEFLFTGGYLPTEEEIKEAIKQTKERIDNWSYPAYLMDFSWRWLYTNEATLTKISYPISYKKQIPKLKMNFLEVPFLPVEQLTVKIWKGENKENLKPLEIAQIAAFKYENAGFQDESWYKKLVQSLTKYPKFRELWPKVDLSQYHKKLFDYEYKRFEGIYHGKKQIFDYHVFTARLINDPRFQVVLYYPAIS